MDRAENESYRYTRARAAVLLIMCGDVAALFGALLLSLALHFDGQPLWGVYHTYLKGHLLSVFLSLGLYIGVFAAFRLYRYAWRFASLGTLSSVIYANSLGLLGFVGAQHVSGGVTLPRSVMIIFWMTSIAFVGGVRVLLRLASIGQRYGGLAVRILKRDLGPRRVVILGGGSSGARVVKALHEDLQADRHVIGFLDDEPRKHGTYIRDVRVLGPLEHLHTLIAERAVDEVLIALPYASGDDIRHYVMACRKQKIPVKIIPALSDVLKGNGQPHIEEISVEDLLRRPPVRIEIAKIGGYLSGKRVLVTGAGGSIGSEMCRQILALNPARLVLLGHGENSIHNIHQELASNFPVFAERLHMAIGSVTDEARMDQVFGQHKPHVVFHAAAHKHVPIMEANLLEAVQNNVLGTSCIAGACGTHGVQRMVLISSDKAVYPCSVMGATKWLCEELLRAIAPLHPDTTYVTVRFGNVLGSRGSVVPIFHEQIKMGGPVTVTHAEMTRYFMSIPEAVQLVLQAGAVGRSGELYLLDMGKPVRVLDLAHDMIRLCGYEPEEEIKVIFTGMRPGEKLHETLTAEGERSEPATCQGLSVVYRPNHFGPSEFFTVLRRVQQVQDHGDSAEMRELLSEVVSGFDARTLLDEARPTSQTYDSAAHS